MAKKRVVLTKEDISLHLTCTGCDETIIVKADDVIWYAHAQECDICGSHGEMQADITCNNCGHDIHWEIDTW